MSLFRRRPVQPTPKMLKAIAEFRYNERHGIRPDLDGAVYHGGCLGCVYMRGNDMRTGIVWCLGCRYANFNSSLPDLKRGLPEVIRQ